MYCCKLRIIIIGYLQTCDSPQVLGEAEEKLLKAAQEVNQLRVEESTLRQENLLLRVSINVKCLDCRFFHRFIQTKSVAL